MNILKRYILIQLLGPFLLGVGIFSFVFLLAFIFELAEAIIVKGVPLKIAFLVLLIYVPTTFGYTIPMGALMANLITWGRLKERGEITAIKASGISLGPAISLVVVASFILSLGLYLSNDLLLPRLSHAYRQIWSKSIQGKHAIPLDEGVFVELGRFEFFIQKLNKDQKRLEGIYIKDWGEGSKSPPLIIFAQSGEYRLQGSPGLVRLQLLLKDGTTHQMDKKDPSIYHLVKFKTKTLNIETALELKGKEIGEMGSAQLREKIREYKKSGLDPTSLIVELHKKQAIPFACLAFTLIGIPLGLSIRRSGGAVGFGMSLVFIFVYYIFLIGGESLALKGYLPPLIAVWMANLILVFTGSILITRVLRR